MTRGPRQIARDRPAEITPPAPRERNCKRCGATFEQPRGPGRQRKYCTACSPKNFWLERNRKRVNQKKPAEIRQVSHAGRRAKPVQLTCTECGATFEGRPNRLVCSRRCKDARYRRLHPEAYKAKQRRKQARLRERKRHGGTS
jgi:hypothetical protein